MSIVPETRYRPLRRQGRCSPRPNTWFITDCAAALYGARNHESHLARQGSLNLRNGPLNRLQRHPGGGVNRHTTTSQQWADNQHPARSSTSAGIVPGYTHEQRFRRYKSGQLPRSPFRDNVRCAHRVANYRCTSNCTGRATDATSGS